MTIHYLLQKHQSNCKVKYITFTLCGDLHIVRMTLRIYYSTFKVFKTSLERYSLSWMFTLITTFFWVYNYIRRSIKYGLKIKLSWDHIMRSNFKGVALIAYHLDFRTSLRSSSNRQAKVSFVKGCLVKYITNKQQ